MANKPASKVLRLDKTLPKLDDIRNNLSAIVLHGDHLWLGGDEGTSLDRMTADAALNFDKHRRFDLKFLLPRNDDTEIDIEGLDIDGGYLWLTGSHSAKRKKPEAEKSTEKNIDRLMELPPGLNRFTIARVPLANAEPVPQHGALTAACLDGDEHGNLLTRALQTDPHIGPFVPRIDKNKVQGIPSKENGLDVEGLAVRGQRVFLGLRGPVLRGWATVLELQIRDASPKILALEKIGASGLLYRKHFLQLDGLGVRDLAIRGKDLHILAGPTMNLDGPVFIYVWKDALEHTSDTLTWQGKDLRNVVSVPFAVGKDHAEGMTFISQDSVMVCYDSPSDKRLVDNDGVRADVFTIGNVASAPA